MTQNIDSIRQEYALSTLSEKDVLLNPILQFDKWFDEAIKAEINEVNAMVLSTVDANNHPHNRVVLLKGLENGQFIFFTNYQSTKGQNIAVNNKVSLLFFWKELQRQVRIDGVAEKISEKASTEYFLSRPIESQLGAWASQQSEVLPSREVLDERFLALQKEYLNKAIPKPPHWGGYAVTPSSIEFWQGRASRLHDRLVFTLTEGEWQLQRLNP